MITSPGKNKGIKSTVEKKRGGGLETTGAKRCLLARVVKWSSKDSGANTSHTIPQKKTLAIHVKLQGF